MEVENAVLGPAEIERGTSFDSPDRVERARTFVAAVVVVVGLVAAGVEAGPHRPAGRIRMLATAYCDGGPTKSGVRAQKGVVAADTSRLPLGTRVQIIAPGQ